MSFENVVRPAVVPNIRPGRAQPSSPSAGSPTQGMATIHGASGRYLELPYSVSFSSSTPKYKEKKRRVDTVRVYQPDNHDNYLDIDVINKLWMDTSTISADPSDVKKQTTTYQFTPVTDDLPDNVETFRQNVIKQKKQA